MKLERKKFETGSKYIFRLAYVPYATERLCGLQSFILDGRFSGYNNLKKLSSTKLNQFFFLIYFETFFQIRFDNINVFQLLTSQFIKMGQFPASLFSKLEKWINKNIWSDFSETRYCYTHFRWFPLKD